jgi:hypothetical protein
MAGSFSDYLENAVLDHLTGVATFTTPTNVYVALYTAAPTDAGGGTEVTGGSYARATVAKGSTNWNTASNGATSNKTAITFATATADWGTVVAVGLLDNSTGGNLLAWADLTANKSVPNGATASFAAGELDITLT